MRKYKSFYYQTLYYKVLRRTDLIGIMLKSSLINFKILYLLNCLFGKLIGSLSS